MSTYSMICTLRHLGHAGAKLNMACIGQHAYAGIHLRPRDPGTACFSVDMDRFSVTARIITKQPADLVDASGNVIEEIAGIKLDLTKYSSYSIIGHGVISRNHFRLHHADEHRSVYVDHQVLDSAEEPTEGTIRLWLQSILASKLEDARATKETPPVYTDEQIAALAAYHVTPDMRFAPPHTPTQAEDGTHKQYITYGIPGCLSHKELYSVNEYLARRFTCTVDGVDQKAHSKWFGHENVKWDVKPVGKLKLDVVDDLMFPLFTDFLGLTDTGVFASTNGNVADIIANDMTRYTWFVLQNRLAPGVAVELGDCPKAYAGRRAYDVNGSIVTL